METRKFAPVPWHDWNGDMKEEIIARQLGEMKEKGIREIIVFPLYGLEIPYLSEAWFAKVRFAVDEAKKLGMKIWIYDELNWPSGTCGGQLIKEKPEFKERGLHARRRRVAPGADVEIPLSGTLLAARGVSLVGAFALTGFRVEDGKLLWKNDRDGDVVIYAFSEKVNDVLYPCNAYAAGATYELGCLDILNAEAVREFIERTHERYKQYLANDLGDCVRTFFTDEPQFHFMFGFGDDCVLPYTPKLFEFFREKRGYDLREKLPELLDDLGDFARTRYDYWSLVTELISESFHGQIARWCRANGVAYTGHLMFEEYLRSIGMNGDLYECLKHMDIPGMDLLGNRTGFANRDAVFAKTPPELLNVTAKSVAGVAAQTGAKRTLCEAFGLMHYDYSLKDLKWITDWLAAMGINTINYNGMAYSVKGFRGIQDPTFTAPWWKYFGLYSDYAARVCAFSAAGESVARTAVLYPTATAWVEFHPAEKPGSPPERWKKIEDERAAVADVLCRSHWEFDYVFDAPLAAAKVENAALIFPNRRYEVLVLPAIATLPENVYLKIVEFIGSGGKVVATGLPSATVIGKGRPGPEFAVIAAEAETLDRTLRELTGKDLEIVGEGARDLVSLVKTNAGKRSVFLANQTEREIVVQVHFSDADTLGVLCPDDGRSYRARADKGRLNLTFYPNESLILSESVEPGAPSWEAFRAFERPDERLTAAGEWRFRTLTPNALSLDARVKVDPRNVGGAERWAEAPDAAFPAIVSRRGGKGMYGMEAFRSMEAVSLEGADYYWIRASFAVKDRPSELALVLDNDEYAEAWLNGAPLSPPASARLWDDANIAYNLTRLVRNGENALTIRKPVNYGERPAFRGKLLGPNALGPIVLSGRFALDETAALVREPGAFPVGPWDKRGYRDFSGTGVYETEVKLAKTPGARYWLSLPGVSGVAELWVNGMRVAVRPWHPYIAEITAALRDGANALAVHVTNAHANLLTAPQTSGLTAPPEILRRG